MNIDTNRKAMSPREIADRVAEYLKEGNLEGIVSLFHPDCMIYFPVTEAPRKGHMTQFGKSLPLLSKYAPLLPVRLQVN